MIPDEMLENDISLEIEAKKYYIRKELIESRARGYYILRQEIQDILDKVNNDTKGIYSFDAILKDLRELIS